MSARLLRQVATLGQRQLARPSSSSSVSVAVPAGPPQSATNEDDVVGGKDVPVSKAMKAYLERAEAHEAFMAEERRAFQVGRRHLANMMGMDEGSMTQEDVDAAIRYLFPSGLFEPKARPFMRDPEIVFPKRKAAEFDRTGRPLHPFFYTRFPNFYELVHNIALRFQECDKYQDAAYRRRNPAQVLQLIPDQEKIVVKGTEWLDKAALEKKLLEPLMDVQYAQFVTAMDRLLQHPFAHKCKAFVEEWRRPSFVDAASLDVPPVEYTEDGRKFCRGEGKRKWAYAWVKVFPDGAGKFVVNGHSYLPDVFKGVQEREVIASPLVLTGLLGKVDVECEVEGGYRQPIAGNIFLPLPRGDEIDVDHGYSARAGAVRYALSRALVGLVDEETRMRIRVAGLLTKDMRYRERKRVGHDGARKEWTWKKR